MVSYFHLAYGKSTLELLSVTYYEHYCHSSIFTPMISSSVGTQNEAVWLGQVRSESSLNASKSSQNTVRSTFVRFGKVWPMLTKFDESWLELTKSDRSLTKTMTRTKSRLDRPFSDNWKEYIKTFNSTLHGSKTDEKRGSYG